MKAAKIIIDKTMSKEEIERRLSEIKTISKPFEAKKYFGKAKLKEDPLKIQRMLRRD